MDFVITDTDRSEVGFLPASMELDIDLSAGADNKTGCNDMELTVPAQLDTVSYGSYIFCPGTEYGGRVLDLKRSTDSMYNTWYLDTWRRMLGQSIIEPPEGEAYRTVSKREANEVIAELLQGRYDGIFRVPDTPSGIVLTGQFDRYVTLLDGLSKMLAAQAARLKITTMQGGTGEAFFVLVEAVPIVDHSEEIEYSQDNRINLTIRDYRRGINHLICLGRGELTERMVRHIYIQKDGSIGSEKYYTGLDERTAILDYANAEDEVDLLKAGNKELLKLANYKKLEMEVQNMDLDIGDIVAGRDRVTGTYLAKPIINKVLKIKKGKETITYKVKGDG